MNEQNRLKIILWLVLAAAIAFWIAVVYQLVQIHRQYRANLITSTRPLPANIEPWMTFEYINVIFKLPPSLLAEKLSITDPRYPHLSIIHLAGEKKEQVTQIIAEVRTDVTSTVATASTMATASSTSAQ